MVKNVILETRKCAKGNKNRVFRKYKKKQWITVNKFLSHGSPTLDDARDPPGHKAIRAR
jgi:hypothetical protein